jgi:hypothetical protein
LVPPCSLGLSIPVCRYIWNAIASSSWSLLEALQNKAFKQAALGKREWVSVHILFLLYSSFFGCTLGMLSVFLRDRLGLSRPRRKGLFFKALSILFVIVILILIVGFTTDSFVVYADLQLNTSFSQRLDALSPYISDQEQRQLRSAWALMKNREDYEKINKQIEEFAGRSHLEIPPPLYR